MWPFKRKKEVKAETSIPTPLTPFYQMQIDLMLARQARYDEQVSENRERWDAAKRQSDKLWNAYFEEYKAKHGYYPMRFRPIRHDLLKGDGPQFFYFERPPRVLT